jgi:N-acyl-D-aspartate/D-glutamate deacylase
MSEEYDILIKNARIIEGTGREAYTGSIGVKGGKVTALGDVHGDAVTEIDASELYASPGWIDAHSHGDHNLLFFPKCENYVMQGVTTFIGGQCGGSPAPIGDMIQLPGIASEHIQELEPHKYYPEQNLFPRKDVNEIMVDRYGWAVDWYSMGDWFEKLMSVGISMNIAPLVGQGTVRYNVLGNDYKRESEPEEIENIKRLIKVALDEGCIGISTGLDYDPGVWASMDEINDCVRILRDYENTVYCPHWRRTGRRREVKFGETRSNKIDGIMESIKSCKVTGVPTNLAHLTPGWRLIPEGNDMMEEMNIKASLKFIDKAIEEGHPLTFDSMPWFIRGGFSVMPYLSSILTPWLREQGGREGFSRWLSVDDYREEVKNALKEGKWFIRLAYNPNTNPQWAENIWVSKHANEEYVGKNVAQIAEDLDRDKLDAFFDLIVEDPDAMGYTSGTADTGNFPWKPYRALFHKHPAHALSLDQSVYDTEYQMKAPPYRMPGINAFSAFPGFLIKMVRETGLLTLEEAIQQLTTNAAKNHKLEGLGKITLGSYADITLFDLDALRITGTPLEPRQQPEGIAHVIINGEPVVKDGEQTEARPGRIVKRS